MQDLLALDLEPRFKPYHLMLMRIGELAQRTGFAESQIRYWERRGLLPEPERSESGYRIYREADVARLRLLGQAKLLGLQLGQAGELLAVAENGCCGETGRAACELIERRISEVDRQIAELGALRGRLEATLATAASPRSGSDDACGGEFCLPGDASEAAARAGAGYAARPLPLVSAGCCEPDCGPGSCG